MDRNSPEYRRLEVLATVLVYTVVFAVLAAIGLGVYALVALISQM